MKAIKILTFIIIGILIIGIGLGAYVYFGTDTFKTNKEIFYKYAKAEQMSQIFDVDSIKQTLTKMESESSEQNIDVNINASMYEQNVLNNANVSFKSKSNPLDNKAEVNVTFGNDNKKDVLEINGVYDKDKYGISFKDITQKYIALENKNLNAFWAKLGLTNIDMDKIETSNSNTKIVKALDETKSNVTELFKKISEQTPKEKYANLGKTQIDLNGTNVETKAYELKLTKEELKQIYSSINIQESDSNEMINKIVKNLNNANFDFSQIIYVYEGKLVRTEITMKDDNYGYIKITKDFESKDNSLTIQITRPNETQVEIGIAKSENDKYTINLGIISEDIEIFIDVNVEMKFNTNFTTTELTDKNSVVINDKSSEEIEQIAETVVKMTHEKEGIESTVLGIFYNLIEMQQNLFEKAKESAEQTNNAIEEERQLVQGSEQLESILQSENN